MERGLTIDYDVMFAQATPQAPMIVTIAPKPTEAQSWADVIVGAFGLTGVLVLIALVLGAVMALVLVKWKARHRPEEDHMPRIA